ncbi:MAG: hypothetical protein OXS29_09450 [bacterium]|nr:hypothetical protein [bacterium]MDE0289473.1 hypothetical protein [bacterium]MDE0439871.1 hypothetical protein [bacterium]
MVNATEGYTKSQTGRLKAEVQAENAQAFSRMIEAVHQAERAAFRQTLWLAALIVASIASAAGLVIAVLR